MGANWYCLFKENEAKVWKSQMLNCCFQASSTFGFELTGHLILQKTLFNEFMLVKALGLEQSKLWLGKRPQDAKSGENLVTD